MDVRPEDRIPETLVDGEPASLRSLVQPSLRSNPELAVDVAPAREPGSRRWKTGIGAAVALVVLGMLARVVSATSLDRDPARPYAPIVDAAALASTERGLGLAPLLLLTSCPDEMALVEHAGAHGDNVCVDRWEGTIVTRDGAGKETPWSPFLAMPADREIKAVSRPNVVPQAYISKHQAEAACVDAGKRLCTSQEWVSACEGPSGTLYPYGATENPKACNTQGHSPLRRMFGSIGRMAFGLTAMNHPKLNQMPGTVARTGAFDKCTNDYGVFDMVGNLHEWTADEQGITGVFRGGYYLDTHVNGKGCGYATTAHGPWYHDYSTGFRCCKDAQ
ncbi:MAG: hypothetical protein NVSMB47_22340 [Polyangiales bacterium]